MRLLDARLRFGRRVALGKVLVDASLIHDAFNHANRLVAAGSLYGHLITTATGHCVQVIAYFTILTSAFLFLAFASI